MGRSRENHFVPKFYLKYFSKDGKQINLFNFSRAKTIRGVSIKHQCSRHNFYDFAPKLEEAFSKLEADAASAVARIKSASALPGAGSPDWISLIGFIVFQKMRTLRAGDTSDAGTDYFSKLMLEGRPELAGLDLNGVEFRHIYPVALPLSIAGEMIPVIADLQMHLFVNATRRELITSDDPVVAHNQYCEGISYRGVLGFACRGLQLFWPLSPQHLLLLYDRDVYKVGRSDHGIYVTNVRSEREIAQLNALQILNAHENVYFMEGGEHGNVEAHCVDMSRRRPKARMVFVETESIPDNATGGESALVHQYEPLLPWRLTVSSIRVRKVAEAVPLHSRGSMYRSSRGPGPVAGGSDIPSGRYSVKKITRK